MIFVTCDTAIWIMSLTYILLLLMVAFGCSIVPVRRTK
jgi:hypothetical protein